MPRQLSELRLQISISAFRHFPTIANAWSCSQAKLIVNSVSAALSGADRQQTMSMRSGSESIFESHD